MKKLISLSLVLALLLTMVTVGAKADPEDMKDQIFSDFSVKTIDGRKFSLSESLKTHDLVLINFWATWCGPCCMEFPFLEEAWEEYADRVDVIALSIEPADTVGELKSFAAEYGLNFSIGRDEEGLFDSMEGNAIPTTLIVNKNRRVLAVEIGCKTSVEEFTDLFDSLLMQEQAQVQPEQAVARCILCFRDPFGNPVPGVQVGFCNGQYDIVESDDDGRVTFDGDPNEYHIHLLQVPDGYTAPWSQLQIWGNEYDLTVTLYSDGYDSGSVIYTTGAGHAGDFGMPARHKSMHDRQLNPGIDLYSCANRMYSVNNEAEIGSMETERLLILPMCETDEGAFAPGIEDRTIVDEILTSRRE